MEGSESNCLGAVEARATDEAGGWLVEHVLYTVLHQPLWLESDPTGWARPSDPVLSLNVEARVGQDQGRAEVTREVGQKNPRSQGEGGFPTSSQPSLTSTTTAGPCLKSSPLPGTQPSRPQDPDSLFCHLVKDHPVKVASALPFLHGPPHSLLQRHGGLQAGQGPQHWAVSPQGPSGPTARPPPT